MRVRSGRVGSTATLGRRPPQSSRSCWRGGRARGSATSLVQMCTCAATREARSSADNWCLVLLLLGAHGAAAATARPPTEDQLATVRSGVASGGPIEYGNQILDVAVAVTGVPSHLAAPHWAVGGPGGSSSASALPAVANDGQPLRSYDSVNLLKFLSKKPRRRPGR